MPIWIGLFRGINVGGRNKLPMAVLKDTLESVRCKNVRTYIQSGNAVFTSAVKNKANLANRILDAVEEVSSFRPKLILLTQDELASAIAHNPFPDATSQPKSLHFFFLDGKPTATDNTQLDMLATASENYQLIDTVFYLHTPDGFGKSKLAVGVEKKLGVAATARNYATVEKLSNMI